MSFNLEELYNQGSGSSSSMAERTPFLTIKDPSKKVKLMILCEFNELKVEMIHARIEKPDGKTGDVRCIGKKMGCPLCLAEQRVQKRAYIPVLDLEDRIVKILPMSLGKNYANVQNLAMFFQENGTVKDMIWIFTRLGTGLATTYSFMPNKQQATPAGTEPPDIEGLINRIPESTIMLSAPTKKGSALDDELGFLSAD
jgi:hypothetical protein